MKYALGILLGIFFMLIAYTWFQTTHPPVIPPPMLSPTPTTTPILPQQLHIIVDTPIPNQHVSLPITISGQARVFENQFSYRIKDAQGNIIAGGTATAHSPDIGQFGPFTITIDSFSSPVRDTITIEVFNHSAKDGSEENLVRIPVLYRAL